MPGFRIARWMAGFVLGMDTGFPGGGWAFLVLIFKLCACPVKFLPISPGSSAECKDNDPAMAPLPGRPLIVQQSSNII